MDLLIAYWPLALVGALVALLLLYLLLRPRQRVALTDSTPVRPHMAVQPKSSFGNRAVIETQPTAVPIDLADQATPQRVRGPETFHKELGPPDDLVKLKGIGPKLAALLNSHGLTRFDQIASLSPAQVDDLDETLGAFRGRLKRDQVVDQADYLARGDIDGFEQKYGKL